MSEGDQIPYGVPGLCSRWVDWTGRSAPIASKLTYRCTMVLRMSFGEFVMTGRELDEQPIKLTRSRSLCGVAQAGGEFEVSEPDPARQRLWRDAPVQVLQSCAGLDTESQMHPTWDISQKDPGFI